MHPTQPGKLIPEAACGFKVGFLVMLLEMTLQACFLTCDRLLAEGVALGRCG